MAEQVNGEAVVEEQSTVLNAEEVEAAVKADEGEVVIEETKLPSDEETYELPEKFKGKSAEEIAKAYQELEKMKSNPDKEEEGGDEESEPEDKDKPKDKLANVDTNKYYESYLENDGLTEGDYEELAKEGLNKEQVDEQIEFIKYKTQKAEEAILDGTPIEEYTAAAVKAKEAWGEDKAAQFNKELGEASLYVQKMMIKNLVSEFSEGAAPTEPLHTSKPQTQPAKGYANRSELLKDIADPRYETDKNCNKEVEEKLAMTDDSSW